MNLPELAVKSVALIVIVAALAFALRHASAAVRHRVWALGFVALAALPLLAVRLPALEVAAAPMVPPVASHPVDLARVRPETTTAFFPVEGKNGASVPTLADERRDAPFPWMDLAEAVWAFGAVLSLAHFALALLSTWALSRRRGEEFPIDPAQGVPPHTRVVRTAAVEVPLTFGFLRPTILLPEAWAGWDAERQGAVLLHEGAHVRRGDWAWLVFVRVVGAFYWPNPLVAWAAFRMRAEAELAADDAVLHAGVEAAGYAGTLVELAASLRDRRRVAALPIVERATLRRRVAAVLVAASPRSPLSRRVALAAGLLAAGVAVPLAAARLGSRPVTFHDGVLDLGAGGTVEVVAVTSMDGGVTRSWDAHGAQLARPWPVDADTRKDLAFVHPSVSPGEKVRYVFFRTPDGQSPELRETPEGVTPTLWPYFPSIPVWGQTYRLGYDLRDARGGSYRVLRLVEPKAKRTTDLYGTAWSDDWRLDGYLKYDADGNQVGMLNPTLNLALSAGSSNVERSRIQADLPGEYAHRRVMIRANGASHAEFDKQSGPLTSISSQIPVASIRTVELFSAPAWDVRLADVALDPNPRATHEPRAFRPAGLVVAQDDRATLPDGTVLRLFEMADALRNRWSPEGRPLTGRTVEASDLWRPKDPALRGIRLAFSRSHNADATLDEFYDGEGRGLPANTRFTSFGPREDVVGLSPIVPRDLRRTDLIVRAVVGKPRTLAGGDLRFGSGGAWGTRLHREPGGKETTLSVALPRDLDLASGQDQLRWVPLGGDGLPLGGSSSTSEVGGRVELRMENASARRVHRLELRARPYAWACFPNVRLYPSG